MQYERKENGRISIHFEGDEVIAMQKAQQAHNQHLEDLGNDSSISAHMKVIAVMQGENGSYNGPDPGTPLEALDYFVDTTNTAVDEILDGLSNPARLEDAGERMKYSGIAEKLIESIKLQSRMDYELGILLGNVTNDDRDDLLGSC